MYMQIGDYYHNGLKFITVIFRICFTKHLKPKESRFSNPYLKSFWSELCFYRRWRLVLFFLVHLQSFKLFAQEPGSLQSFTIFVEGRHLCQLIFSVLTFLPFFKFGSQFFGPLSFLQGRDSNASSNEIALGALKISFTLMAFKVSSSSSSESDEDEDPE